MANRIVQILMSRDELSYEEAVAAVHEARQAVYEGEDPEEILLEWFGLEPDYFFDLV